MFNKDVQNFIFIQNTYQNCYQKNNTEKVNLNDVLLLEYYKLQKMAEEQSRFKKRGYHANIKCEYSQKKTNKRYIIKDY